MDWSVMWQADGGLTLLPPLVAIVLALATKRVIPSLTAAAIVGAMVATRGDVFGGFAMLGKVVTAAVLDRDHIVVSAFSLLVAAAVGVMGRSGGTRALVRTVERWAKNREGAMVSSWLAGAIVFFDDYANCLVVGSAMGPLCDRQGVSRQKLAYIVDATAAPIASLALVSTWVGYEVGLFGDELGTMAQPSAFAVFLSALPYRFYCLFTLAFVGAIAFSGRDFGPMLKVEAEARPAETQTEAAAGSAWLAALPVASLVLVTLGYLVFDGMNNTTDQDASWYTVLGNADALLSMLLGGGCAWIVAALGSLGSRALTLKEVGEGSWGAVRSIAMALVVLYLAWTLGDVIRATGAGTFLAGLLEGNLSPVLLPAGVFILAAATAFATGSSFFTMGALLPLVVPIVVQSQGEAITPIMLACLAAVLDGAVLGDHASPISDTTILASIGANVDVAEHVRTQLPYVLVVGAIAVVVGSLPAGLGASPWLLIPIGMAVSVGAVFVLGKRPTAPTSAPPG